MSALNEDALEAAADTLAACWHESSKPLDDARLTITAYLAVAQPVVNSVEELDALPVGSVVRGGEYDLVGEKIRHSPYPPHWCTIGEEVEAYERDLLPARVLYRPEVNDV